MCFQTRKYFNLSIYLLAQESISISVVPNLLSETRKKLTNEDLKSAINDLKGPSKFYHPNLGNLFKNSSSTGSNSMGFGGQVAIAWALEGR